MESHEPNPEEREAQIQRILRQVEQQLRQSLPQSRQPLEHTEQQVVEIGRQIREIIETEKYGVRPQLRHKDTQKLGERHPDRGDGSRLNHEKRRPAV